LRALRSFVLGSELARAFVQVGLHWIQLADEHLVIPADLQFGAGTARNHQARDVADAP